MTKRKRSIKKELLAPRSKGVDVLLIFRFLKLLHGRFWALGGLLSIQVGAVIGYSIRPDLLDISIPLSRLGTDVRTAPFFAGSMFFAAYCLWRWRIYLSRTLKNKKPVLPLLSLTILGLYLIALMPVTWEVWPARIHNFGVILTGISMVATVVVDGALSRTRKSKYTGLWRTIKLIALLFIIVGGWLVVLSLEEVGVLQAILLGELLMFIGYSIWVVLKVVIGEGSRSYLGKLLRKITA